MKKVPNSRKTTLIGKPADYRYFPIEYPTNIFAITFTDAIEGYYSDESHFCTIHKLDKSKFTLYPIDKNYANIISIGH